VETLEKVGQRAKSVNRKKIENRKSKIENRKERTGPGDLLTPL
jgi:hypothetical protein